jgi:hypothetical protein
LARGDIDAAAAALLVLVSSMAVDGDGNGIIIEKRLAASVCWRTQDDRRQECAGGRRARSNLASRALFDPAPGIGPRKEEMTMAVMDRGVHAHITPEPDIKPVPEQEPTPPEAPHIDPDPAETPLSDPVPIREPIPHQVPMKT